MSDKPPEKTPAEELRETIAAQLRRFSVFAPPELRDTLKSFDVWVVDVERRVDMLAAQLLRVYYGIEPHEAQLDGLASMGDQSRMVGLCKREPPDCPCGGFYFEGQLLHSSNCKRLPR